MNINVVLVLGLITLFLLFSISITAIQNKYFFRPWGEPAALFGINTAILAYIYLVYKYYGKTSEKYKEKAKEIEPWLITMGIFCSISIGFGLFQGFIYPQFVTIGASHSKMKVTTKGI